MNISTVFQSLPVEYPNHLSLAEPGRKTYPSAGWLLLLLVALCATPRLVIALRIPGIAGDGVNYVYAAQSLEAHNFHDALWEGGLNIYIAILAGLHQIGLDWELAAKIWGILVSCLVVLPLWGWIRRQFDDRVALTACLLYIVHPKFILESPELMRDPIFWLFFTAALYFLWRAVTEVRYGFFLVCGAAITLAALTRIEGVFLLLPLVLWTFWRWMALRTGRMKLLAGAVLCVVAFPALLLLVNAVVLYGHSDWATIRLAPLARCQAWLASLVSVQTPTRDMSNSPPGVGLMLWRFFPTMTRGLSPVFALLMFGGMWKYRRIWSRRDNQALFYTAIVVLLGIWVQAWSNRYLKANINARYALTIVLMGAPFAALGLLSLVIRLAKLVELVGWQNRGRITVVAAVAAVVLIPSLADVSHNSLANIGLRRNTAIVGRWLRNGCIHTPRIVGPWDMVLPVGYYAGSKLHTSYRYDEDIEAILALIDPRNCDVILLQPDGKLTPKRCQSLADRIVRLEFAEVPTSQLPGLENQCRVFLRSDWLNSARRSESIR